MLSRMKIGRRLVLLISALTMIFLSAGFITLIGLTSATQSTSAVNSKVEELVQLEQIASVVSNGYVLAASDLYLGKSTWKDAGIKISKGKEQFNFEWNKLLLSLDASNRELYDDLFTDPVLNLNQAFDDLLEIVKLENRGLLTLFMLNDAGPLSTPFMNGIEASSHLEEQTSTELMAEATQKSNNFLFISVFVVGLGLIIAFVLGRLIYRSITNPISKISSTIHSLTSGDLDARTEISGRDELGQLGMAFDELLNERNATLTKAEKENDQLNDSIIELLETTEQLGNRDLTVAAKVAEDVTGPVADAMNMIASETARVLSQIYTISESVEEAANTISDRGQHINSVADSERMIVQTTMEDLGSASISMNEIAGMAEKCNTIAEFASQSTSEALDSVINTTDGMNDIRETISETEKRIKQLGERSQEITGVVQIINNIAERTHVLALNASMQAAAAGEAGRGFAVVADEVQRLAESSRQSTAEIGALVTNIQSETAETMATMNRTISQVIEGTEIAQRSGEKMKETQKTTLELASAVAKITKQSLTQAGVNNALREKAIKIISSTEETSKELKAQETHTDNLVEYSKNLIESVRLFKLPS